MRASLFFIPPTSAVAQERSIQELGGVLFLFAIAFTAAAVIFYPKSEFSKKVRELF
jgi:hypothetical protein